MKKITTKDGFTCQVDEACLNDMEFLDDIVTLSTGESIEQLKATGNIINKLLGADGKKQLYNFLRDDKGHVPVEALSKEIGEILLSLGAEGKNS